MLMYSQLEFMVFIIFIDHHSHPKQTKIVNHHNLDQSHHGKKIEEKKLLLPQAENGYWIETNELLEVRNISQP